MSTWHLDVTGSLWSGPRSAYRYKITEEQGRALLSCDANISAGRFAGDFATVDDFRITETVRAYQIGRDFRRELVEERRHRNWKDRNNGRRFARMVEGY